MDGDLDRDITESFEERIESIQQLLKPPTKVSPGNVFWLAARNFKDEWNQIFPDLKRNLGLTEENDHMKAPNCFGFTLSNDGILEFEKENPPPNKDDTPWFVQALYDVLLFFVDRAFDQRPIERFWFLETVARMPYFSYVTCLHLYETLGWWRTAELRKIHFAEEWNELHHLLIMESLGGDARWRDRFLGLHAAIAYYWVLVACYLVSPKYSYRFSEMLETHAVSTYHQFLLENEAKLRRIAAPGVAASYYGGGDLYMFDADSALVREATGAGVRRPPTDTLYDVFVNILEDEWEHVKTMVMCQDYETLEGFGLRSGPGALQGSPARSRWKAWAEGLQEQEARFLDFGRRRRRRQSAEGPDADGPRPTDDRASGGG
uniref:Ubiquinol oxidase n=1 Tax=Tetraselmis sp. GSL018 TaxID=582737 RepID=A0A061QYB1_9CHLO